MIGLSKLAEPKGKGEKGENLDSKNAPMLQEMGQLGLAKKKAEKKDKGGVVPGAKNTKGSNVLAERTEQSDGKDNEKKAEMDMAMSGNLMGLSKAKAKKKKEQTEKKAGSLGLSKIAKGYKYKNPGAAAQDIKTDKKEVHDVLPKTKPSKRDDVLKKLRQSK